MYRLAATLGAGALLILSAGEPAAQAPKPNIQPLSIRPPVVTPNIPLDRLVDEGQESDDSAPAETPEKASVATEPVSPASPAVTQAAAPVRPWLPAASPLPLPRVDEQAPGLARLPGADEGRDHEHESDTGSSGDVDTAGVLPPELGGSPEIEEHIKTTGGNASDVRDAVTFLKEGPIDQSAAPEHLRDGGENLPAGIGGERPFGANRVGVWDALGGRGSAFGPEGRNDEYGVDMMDGIPRSPASQAPRDGKSSSDGWTHQNGRNQFDGSFYRLSSRANAQGGGDYRTEVTYPDGSMTITETSTSTDSKGVETETSYASYEISAPDEKGNRTVEIHKYDGSNAPTEESAEDALVTGFDQDGDGEPDGPVDKVITTPVPAGGQDSQPNPADNGVAEGICSGWNPLTGCATPGVKAQDAISQPNPTDDGSATVRSAGASIGPEAVTNSGDGSFGAGDNIGGSGGFGHDPCATVRGCGGPSGGGGPGPEGPPQP